MVLDLSPKLLTLTFDGHRIKRSCNEYSVLALKKKQSKQKTKYLDDVKVNNNIEINMLGLCDHYLDHHDVRVKNKVGINVQYLLMW